MVINIEIDSLISLCETDLNIGPINNIETGLVNSFAYSEVPASVGVVNHASAIGQVGLTQLIHSPPTSPLCVPLRNGVAYFQWIIPNKNILKYEIYLSINGSVNENTFTLLESTEDNRLFIRGLPVNESLYFKIRAMYIDDAFSEMVDMKLGMIDYSNHLFRVIGITGSTISKDAVIGFTDNITGHVISIKNTYELTL